MSYTLKDLLNLQSSGMSANEIQNYFGGYDGLMGYLNTKRGSTPGLDYSKDFGSGLSGMPSLESMMNYGLGGGQFGRF